jgi:hypothetical protein
MTCTQTREYFVDALYSELDAVTRREFEEHLSKCVSCASEYDKMRASLSIMDKRVRTEPDKTYWDEYWNSLQKKLKDTSHARRPGNLYLWRPMKVPAWAYGIAAALVLAIGIYIGRTYFNSSGTTGVQEQGPASTSLTSRSDSTTREALVYLERSKNLLIGLTNIDEGHQAFMNFSRHQQVSRRLIEQGNVLTVALNRPDQQLIRQLIQDLQIILLQLANIEVTPGVPAIELVKKGINEKSILLKINLEEMRAAARQSPKEISGKKNSKNL